MLALLPLLLAAAPEPGAARSWLAVATAIGEREAALSAPDAEAAARAVLAFVPGRELVADGEQAARIASQVRGCGVEAACAGRVLAGEHVEAVLWLVVDSGEPALLTARLVDSGGRALGTTLEEIVPSALDRGRVERATRAVLERAGITLGGRLKLVVTPPDAEVTVAGAAAPLPRESLLPAGELVFVATHPEHERLERRVVLHPGATALVELRLEPKESSLLASPWLWAGVALVVAGAAVGAGLLATRGTELCVPGDAPECRD